MRRGAGRGCPQSARRRWRSRVPKSGFGSSFYSSVVIENRWNLTQTGRLGLQRNPLPNTAFRARMGSDIFHIWESTIRSPQMYLSAYGPIAALAERISATHAGVVLEMLAEAVVVEKHGSPPLDLRILGKAQGSGDTIRNGAQQRVTRDVHAVRPSAGQRRSISRRPRWRNGCTLAVSRPAPSLQRLVSAVQQSTASWPNNATTRTRRFNSRR
jgi:hypothetical protein